jgi:flagellin
VRIVHNLAALNANRVLQFTNLEVQKNLEKLSSGLRINRAGDDAAGLAISESMRAAISAFNQSRRNGQDAISLVQTAEGALDEVHSILRRMRDLAVQAANGTYTTSDRRQIQIEVSQLVGEINRIVTSTHFNNLAILTGRYNKYALANASSERVESDRQQRYGVTRVGTAQEVRGGSMVIHIGSQRQQIMTISIGNMLASALGVQISPTLAVNVGGRTASIMGVNNVGGFNAINMTLQFQAEAAIGRLTSAIDFVSRQRAQLGAFQNRLEHAVKNLAVEEENLQAAESRIRDVDMAEEMMQFTKNQILVQSGTSMLAQANVQPQSVLSLLR